MKQTIIVCSSNRPIQDQTRQAIEELERHGAQLLLQTGSADVAFARNMALSGALRFAVTANKELAVSATHPGTERRAPFDTILMVDDDMVFSLEQAQTLLAHARKTGFAASAMYATMRGSLAATRLYTPPAMVQRWLVGLGLLAIPFPALQELARRSRVFEAFGTEHVEFTWSAALGDCWCAEDYTLCRRLGGVHLLPVAVGHMKTIPIYPDAETIECIRKGRRLPGDLDSKVLAHIEDPDMLAQLKGRD